MLFDPNATPLQYKHGPGDFNVVASHAIDLLIAALGDDLTVANRICRVEAVDTDFAQVRLDSLEVPLQHLLDSALAGTTEIALWESLCLIKRTPTTLYGDRTETIDCPQITPNISMLLRVMVPLIDRYDPQVVPDFELLINGTRKRLHIPASQDLGALTWTNSNQPISRLWEELKRQALIHAFAGPVMRRLASEFPV